jgi:zinc protease
MFNPLFEQSAFDRVKNQLIQNLTQNKKDANVLSGQAFKQLMYGKEQRVGLPDSGTINTVTSISLEDIKAFYQRYFSPQYANLIVVGDINKSELLPKLEYLTNWQGEQYNLPVFSNFPEINQQKIYFVDLPDATQSVIKIGRRSLPYDAVGDHFKASLMNYPLGGAFNSRINLNLREDKGYTYGASSGFSGGKTLGWFKAGASVKQAHTADAMQEITKELSQYQKSGITAEESEFMRQAISQNEALSFETPSQKSGFLRQLLQFNLPTNYGEQQNKIIESISIESLNELAHQELSQPMHWLVVGDGSKVKPQLEQLGINIIDFELVE